MKRLIACLVLVCLAGGASAHKLAPSLLQIDAVFAHHYAVLWRTPAMAGEAAPEPVFPPTCELTEPAVRGAGSAMEWRWEMTCPQGLSGETLAVTGLGDSRTAALLRLTLEGGRSYQYLASAAAPRFVVPARGEGLGVAGQYLALGVKHILIGVDHLLLVTGLLLLAAGWRQLLLTVTAFTVGHSLTLALVSLQLIPNRPSLVELAIAVTILLLALELSRPDGGKSLLARRQWPVAAVFGLIHGLGFAAMLDELGLPGGDLFAALLSFNIGIEVGQLLFLAMLYAVLWTARQGGEWAYNTLRIAAVYGMGGMAVYWCIDRGIGLLSEFLMV